MIDIKSYNQRRQIVRYTTRIEREKIHQVPGIVGTGITHSAVTGIGDDEFQIVVFIENEKYRDDYYNPYSGKYNLPRSINGVQVVPKVIGTVEATKVGAELNDRYRPVKGGASVNNIRRTLAGTITGFPIDMSPEGLLPDGTRRRIILSNNHVLAYQIQGFQSNIKGIKGDHITQPATRDGGIDPDDKIGELDRWVTIPNPHGTIPGCEPDPEDYSKCLEHTNVDCACGTIDQGIDIDNINLCNYDIDGWIDPIPGTFVKKAGRTTECTESYIFATDVSVRVGYGGPVHRFYDQMVIIGLDWKIFGKPGDSGSLIVHKDYDYAIGILFAGSILGWIFANPIGEVQRKLQVSFGNKKENPPLQPMHTYCTWNHFSPVCELELGEGENRCTCSISCDKHRYVNVFHIWGGGNCTLDVYRYMIRIQSMQGKTDETMFNIGQGHTALVPTGLGQTFELSAQHDSGWEFDRFCIGNPDNVLSTEPFVSILPDDYIGMYECELHIYAYFRKIEFGEGMIPKTKCKISINDGKLFSLWVNL